MIPLLKLPVIPVVSLLVWLGLSCPAASAGIEDLSPATRMELDLITGSHVENLAEARRPLAELEENYAAALEKRKATAQAEGKLDLVLRIEEEKKRVAEGAPPEGDVSDHELIRLAGIYLNQRAKLNESLQPALANAWRLHKQKVEGMVTLLTKEGKIGEAKIVREQIGLIDLEMEKLKKLEKTAGDKARDLLLSKTWAVKMTGEPSFDVKFTDDGKVIRLKDQELLWKWKLDEQGKLTCTWLSSGWVKFDFSDSSASTFRGESRGGDRYLLTAK